MIIHIAILSIFILILIPGLLSIFRNMEHKIIDTDVRLRSGANFIQLSDGYTHYEINGYEADPVVLLIHGFSVPLYMWDNSFKPLVESGFRVVRYDMYGRGLSDRPDVNYDSSLFIRQIYELMTGLEIYGKVHIVGTSMGGAVAAAFAEYYPSLVESIVLIDPVHEPINIGIKKIPFIGTLIAYSFHIPNYPELQLNDFFDQKKFSDWPDRYLEQMKYYGFRKAIISTLRHFLVHDPEQYFYSLKENKIPALLVWGRDDKTVPLHGLSRLKNLINPQILIVFEAGHLPHYERPEVVNPVLISFLKQSSYINQKAYI